MVTHHKAPRPFKVSIKSRVIDFSLRHSLILIHSLRRFAEFVQGGSHLKPEELVEHSHHDHTDEFAIAQENGVHDINESDFSEDDD